MLAAFEQMANNPATEKACLRKEWPKLAARHLSHGQHTPPTIIYLLPVLGGRNVFESGLLGSDVAAASKASLALILCGEKAEATSWGSFMILASLRRMYRYRRSTKKRKKKRRAIIGPIRTAEHVCPVLSQPVVVAMMTWQFSSAIVQ
jgi:hypothetical protein